MTQIGIKLLFATMSSRLMLALTLAVLAICPTQAQYENIWTGPTDVVFRYMYLNHSLMVYI